MSLVRVNLLYMSICGGLLILTVLCLRLLLKGRLPKRTFAILWCVALLRLVLPFAVDSPVGVFSAVQEGLAALGDWGWTDRENGPASPAENLFPEGLYFGEDTGYGNGIVGNSADRSGTDAEGISADGAGFGENGSGAGAAGFSLIRKIYRAVVLFWAVLFLLLYLNCLRRFRAALPVEDPAVERWLGTNRLCRKVSVRQSDRISSPLTYGLIRPVILLPKRLEKENGRKLEYILQHELVHIRRFDGAWKLILSAALCLHWFNPLVWAMYVFMNRDLELACDEGVLRIFGTEARKGYALTLIGMEERRLSPMQLYSGFGKNAVEERIGEIMKYKKKTKAVMFAGGLLILTVVSVFATTSRANEVPSGADAGIPEESRDASIPMDPPEGILGSMSEPELDGADGAPGRDADPGADLQTEGTVPSAENLPGSSGNEESGYRLVYVKEGFPESEPAQLVTGQGFRLLIPLEGWTSFGPDGWMSEINNEVEIWGACFTSEGSDYEGFDREQIVAALQKEGYQEDNGSYWRNEEGRMMTVELRQTNDQDIWGIFYTYPEEGEDGWGVELRAMAQTFTALSPEAPEVGSGAEGEAAGREWKSFTRRLENENAVMALLGDFMDAAGGKDHDAVLQYVAEGAEAETECLDWIREWKQEEISLQFQPEEDYCTASIQVVTNDNDGSSNEYLTVEMVKEAEGWKISWMGIEK